MGKHTGSSFSVGFCIEKAVFGRIGGIRDQIPVGRLTKIVAQELTSTPQNREDVFQVRKITCKLIVLPQRKTHPRTSHWEKAAVNKVVHAGAAKNIGGMIDAPAVRAKLLPSGPPAKARKHLDEMDKRLRSF